MEINNKIIACVVIGVLILLWYTRKINNECNRYKEIIDIYMKENTLERMENAKRLTKVSEEHMSKNVKKNVRFRLPDEN